MVVILVNEIVHNMSLKLTWSCTLSPGRSSQLPGGLPGGSCPSRVHPRSLTPCYVVLTQDFREPQAAFAKREGNEYLPK